MTDPFDVLRRSADTPAGSTVEIDPSFRAEVLDEARRRLSGAPVAARRRVASTADIDERTEMTMMPVDRPRWMRRMLLAAACVVLVAGTVLALTTLVRSDGDEPADTPPVSVTTTVTTNPATSLPAGSPLTDEQLVAAILLDPAELGLSRVEPVRGREVTDTRDPHQFDLDRYSARPECSAFDEVFEPLESSTHADRYFGLPPSQPVDQIVAVFPDEATATAVFDGWLDPAFAPCLELYSYQWAFRFRRSYGAALRGVGGQLRLLHLRTAGRPDQRRRYGAGGPDVDVRRRFDHVVRASPAADVRARIREETPSRTISAGPAAP